MNASVRFQNDLTKDNAMITGYATQAGTAQYAGRYDAVAYNTIEPHGLQVSQAGFGCYRVSAGVQVHATALEKALQSGINLIDTSTNYADGGSERLVGDVLRRMLAPKSLSRDQVVIVSKVGYLQGENLNLSREKNAAGTPFPDLVEYGPDLQHCIHPEFIADQLTRSLDRLGLTTLDCYLLHNPEYYLEWARKTQMPLEEARAEYYRRIQLAFVHLEKEVTAGRIRTYGISSNTFPAARENSEFTSLETIYELALRNGDNHHFALVQMPLNILEKGAVLEKNQPGPKSVLALAHEKHIGVLVNRPLNAFDGNSLVRLADMKTATAQPDNAVIRKIRTVIKSETRLWRKILPACDDIPDGIKLRIKEQVAVGDVLKHYWKNFGSHERWRQTKNSMFVPRVQGVFQYLAQQADKHADLADWIEAHAASIEDAFQAVASLYGAAAVRRTSTIKATLSAADPDWAQAPSLSQAAVRVIRSTMGVSAVLVGMRRVDYVDDVLAELRRPVQTADRTGSWEAL